METLNELYTKRDELRKELESIQFKINTMENEEKHKKFNDFYNKIKDQYVEIDLADGDKVFGYVVDGDARMSVIKLTNILKICGDVFFFIPQSGFYIRICGALPILL